MSLCPWRGSEEEATQQMKVKTAAPVAPGRFGSDWPVQCVGEGPVGAAARLIPVKVTSSLGLLYTLQPEEKPLEMRRRMLLYVWR